METFTELRDFVDNPGFRQQRRDSLRELNPNAVDAPIVDIVDGFARLPYCFTLQCCCGHFVHSGESNPHNIRPLPVPGSITSVEYRIAYVALCIESNDSGRALYQGLCRIPEIAPELIQFGCAEWFWKRQVNSYALQVEPKRYMTRDKAVVDFQEALLIEEARNGFFAQLRTLVQKHLGKIGTQ